MQGYHHEPRYAASYASRSPQLHEGVRNFMNGVYAWMAGGIALTAAVAFGVSQSPATMDVIYSRPLFYLVMFAPLIMAWVIPSRLSTMSRGMAVASFGVFAAMLGVGLGYIPHAYSAESIGGVLLATIGMFAAMAVIGFVTKKDLSGIGQFLVMALIGAVIASLVNVFVLHSVGLSLAVSAIVAVVAAGLTAYHTQAVKQLYMMHGGGGNLAILGALLLYVDFINLFLSLLRLFGGSRD